VRLLVSEVVTNAVLYGVGESIEVDVRCDHGRLRVEVGDPNPSLPIRRRPGPGSTSGRGLELVDVLALAWGADPLERGGKVVWFEVVAADARTVPIFLLAIPVHLFVRHAMQMDDVLHELRLRGLDNNGSSSASARLSQVAAELADAFAPFHHGALAAAELARRRGQEAVDLELPLPSHDGQSAIELMTMLGEADELCRLGQLMALPAPGDVAILRRWVAAEVVRQLAGEPPNPYRG